MKSDGFFTCYIAGPSGAGKSEMVNNVCAKLNKPLVRVSITNDTKEGHLLGEKTLINGNVVYEIGPVVWAAEEGAVLVLDEVSSGSPEELMCLHAALEGKPFFVKSANKLVTPAPGFMIIATDNTKGRGDTSGRYIGTTIQNEAFLERFMVTMMQNYPSEKVELDIMTRAFKRIRKVEELSKVDAVAVEQLNKWVQVIRKSFNEESVDDLIATRRSVFILRTYAAMRNMEKSIELCTNRFDDSTQTAFLTLWNKMQADEATTV